MFVSVTDMAVMNMDRRNNSNNNKMWQLTLFLTLVPF